MQDISKALPLTLHLVRCEGSWFWELAYQTLRQSVFLLVFGAIITAIAVSGFQATDDLVDFCLAVACHDIGKPIFCLRLVTAVIVANIMMIPVTANRT